MQAAFMLDYDVLTVERPQKVYLMARFVAGPGPNDRQRKPLNLALVIDRSGSMAGTKIDYTRQAAQFLVQHLTPKDSLAIVLYDDRVETLLAAERVVDKDAIHQLLEGVRARGTTNLSGGWLEGCQQVARHSQPMSLNRVLLMSDGLANRGITDPSALTQLARQKRDEGISTTTMGMGQDFNEDLLMAMAEAGGGAYYFIESPEVAPSIFQEELSGLLSVVGQNLVIHLNTSSEVTQVRQLNAYPMSMSNHGRSSEFRLGDVYGEEVKTLVLELSIPALSSLGEKIIATLRFEYDEINNGGTHHRVQEMPVMVNVQAQDAAKPQADVQVTQAVLLLRAANARQEAVRAADRGAFHEATQALREVAQAIEAAGLSDPQLLEERVALLKQAEKLEQGAQAYNDYERKSMSSQAYYSMTSRHSSTVALRGRENMRKPGSASQGGLRQNVAQGTPPTHLTWRGQTFALTSDVMRIGRAPDNEIVIDQRGISRYHAVLRRVDGALYIEDNQSTNGVVISGRAIHQPYSLSAGEVAVLGEEKLMFHLGELSS
ncbi:MAG: VWA domain-containing protein [Anaerolineae bacterium]|nr:VWA domain-containing protein [Anaerolineae bacterium]MDW8173665.1 VWA domain-containing protein [Anaerolineae bacterium]